MFQRSFGYAVRWSSNSLSLLRTSLRSYGLWDHLNRIVIDTIFTIDTAILSWYASVGPIADYTIALRFTSLLFLVPMQLHLGLQIALSNYTQRSDQVDASNAFLKLNAAASLLQLLAVWLLGEWLLRLLFGAAANAAVARYTLIIALGVTSMNLSLPLLSVINNLGDLRRAFTRVFLPMLLLGFASYLFAASRYGALGLAWANVAVYALFAAWLALYTARHHPFEPHWKLITPRERRLLAQLLRGRSD